MYQEKERQAKDRGEKKKGKQIVEEEHCQPAVSKTGPAVLSFNTRERSERREKQLVSVH